MIFRKHGRDNGKHFVEVLEDGELTGKTLEVTDKELEALEKDEAKIAPHATQAHKATHKIVYADPEKEPVGETGPVTVAQDGTVTRNEVPEAEEAPPIATADDTAPATTPTVETQAPLPNSEVAAV